MTSLVEQPLMTRARNADLLDVRQLVVEYGWGERAARAVDGVDFAIREGEVLGVALLAPDFEALKRMARRRGVSYTTMEDLLRAPQVRDLFANEIKGFDEPAEVFALVP